MIFALGVMADVQGQKHDGFGLAAVVLVTKYRSFTKLVWTIKTFMLIRLSYRREQ